MKARTYLAWGLAALLIAGCSTTEQGHDDHNHVDLLPLTQGGQWGFVNLDGEWVVEPQYMLAEVFSEERARVMIGNLWGYIDTEGNPVTDIQFERATRFSEGKAAVGIGGSYGYIGLDGTTAISFEYQRTYSFSDSLACVRVDTLYGYINHDNEMVIEPRFLAPGTFKDGAAKVTEDGKLWGLINKEGQLVGGRWFEGVEDFSEGYAAVQIRGQWGFMDSTGTVVIEPQYGKTYPMAEGRAVVGNPYQREWWIIDTQGNVIVDTGRYAFIRSYTEGMAPVRAGANWGFVDLSGKEVIPCDVDGRLASWFHDGLAPFSLDGKKWGFMDKQGRTAIEPVYDAVRHEFHGGVALVQSGALLTYINTKGEVIAQEQPLRQ